MGSQPQKATGGGDQRPSSGGSSSCGPREATGGDGGSCRQQEEEKLSSFELKLSWRRLLRESAQARLSEAGPRVHMGVSNKAEAREAVLTGTHLTAGHRSGEPTA